MYNSLDDRELRIHPLNCIANHLCMALFNKLWHRAKIINRSDDDTKVKVLYVDLGTTAEIPMANVKYMRNEFTKLPMQACRGCLDYIRPVETHWLRSTTMYFLKLLNDEPVYAKVTSIDDGVGDLRLSDYVYLYNVIWNLISGRCVWCVWWSRTQTDRSTCKSISNWFMLDMLNIMIRITAAAVL